MGLRLEGHTWEQGMGLRLEGHTCTLILFSSNL